MDPGRRWALLTSPRTIAILAAMAMVATVGLDLLGHPAHPPGAARREGGVSAAASAGGTSPLPTARGLSIR